VPWIKGESGNPAGRPAKKTARREFRRLLEQPEKPRGKQTRYEVWIEIVIKWAGKDGSRIMEVLRWLEGPSPPPSDQPHEELEESRAQDARGNPIEP
jgi:hypothetical protein